MKKEVETLRNDMDILTEKYEEIEQSQKANNAVIYGLDIRTFAEAAQGEPDQSNAQNVQLKEPHDMDNTIKNFLKFSEKIDARISKEDISAIFHLKTKMTGNDKKRPVLVKFSNPQAKSRLFQKKRHLKDLGFTGVYINEDLTAKNASLFKIAREFKRNGRIEGTWTKGGKVYIKKLRGEITTIKKEDQLKKLDQHHD